MVVFGDFFMVLFLLLEDCIGINTYRLFYFLSRVIEGS